MPDSCYPVDPAIIAAAPFRKSRRSDNSGSCVEVADLGTIVLLRDTKNRDGGVLAFTPAAWAAFIDGTKDGQFDQ